MIKQYKHKIVIGCEVLLLCMMIGVLGTKAASSNPPSNGVSYNKNSQTTVEGALNDLYTKADYGDAAASHILKGKTALVGGSKVTGTYEAPSLASQTSATAGAGDILKDKTAYVNGNKITGSMTNRGAVTETVSPGGTYTIPEGYHNGSGKATCSTCESEGYYKYYYFNKDATVKESYVAYDGSWRRMAHDQLSGCSGGVCTGNSQGSVFEIDLGFTPSEVKEYNVFLEPKRSGEFKISASTGDWRMYRLMSGISFQNSSSQNLTTTRVSVSGSKLQFSVDVSREAMTNGTADSAISTNASSFILRGDIIYK